MNENDLKQLLEHLASTVNLRPQRNYWMVRTSNGMCYTPFLQNGIVALQLEYISNTFIANLRHQNADNVAQRLILSHLQTIADNSQHGSAEELASSNMLSTRASQLFNFYYKMKAGDMVLIPDKGADYISIGILTEDFPIIGQNINNVYPVARQVRWVNQIPKYRLEPGLYRALGAHQALANISKYAEYLERNFGSCFMMGNACHYVLAINSEQVSADMFFGMGNTLMKMLQKLSEQYGLGINTQDIHLSLNLNSPGKIDFIATPLIAFLIMALLTVCSNARIDFSTMPQLPMEEFNRLVEIVSQPIQQEEEIRSLNDSLLHYLNGTEAQSVEQYNQNTLDALHGNEGNH